MNKELYVSPIELTEEEKKEILSKYDGTTSNELLNHLKRNFPI